MINKKKYQSIFSFIMRNLQRRQKDVGSLALILEYCSNTIPPNLVRSVSFVIFAVSSLSMPFFFSFWKENLTIANGSIEASLSKTLIENIPLDYETCRKNGTDNPLVLENWCMDSNNVPRYVGKEQWPPRSTQRYTFVGFEKCMGNKTLVFAGDSRVRYQFLALASYLQTKKNMKCVDYQTIADEKNITISPDPQCYLIDHSTGFSSWNQWYENTAADFPGSLCDCYRPNRFKPALTFENRFVRIPTPFGDINLIYLQSFANLIRMNEDFPPYTSFAPNSKRCKPGNCGAGNRKNVFEGNLNETLWNIVPKLNATHVFANTGWELLDYSCEIRDFERQHPDIKTFFLSHPVDHEHKLGEFDATTLKCDSNIVDRYSMSMNVPSTWYWDKFHVLSILNEEFNHLLVKKICDK